MMKIKVLFNTDEVCKPILFVALEITIIFKKSGLSWAYMNVSDNKMQKMNNGNGKTGYNLGLWNCRRGLVDKNKEQSHKMVDVKNFLKKKKIHMLCLIEADLHNSVSRIKRSNPITTAEIHKILEIPGYRIFLPRSWETHGQARILVYAKNELQVTEKNVGVQNSDLPTISFEIGLGREKKTLVNFFYREFTGGVSGLNDANSQNERISRQTRLWKTLQAGKRDFICLGDANIDASKWYDDNYKERAIAEIVQAALIETNNTQLIKEYTRSEFCQGNLIRSCIDHCYTNVPEKVSKPEVLAIGDSDHLGIAVTKYTRAPVIKPKTIKKRSYKNFDMELFLRSITNSELNEKVCACYELDQAAEAFEKAFKDILDKHAPIKTFQMRKNYSPFVSEKTKRMMQERNELKEEALKTGNRDAERLFKKKGREIKKALSEDEREYFSKDFGEISNPANAWKTAKVILGVNSSLAPTVIKSKNEKGETEIITNPLKMANIFNNFFRQKVKNLREETNRPPKVPPGQRLQRWLEKMGTTPPPFQLKPIKKEMLRKIIRRMKPKRVHGTDWIDSYSIKVSSPLIEDCLLHLINLSISQSKFSSRWKPQLIFPTFKKNEKDRVENYRPVCHLIQIGKMVEYAVYFQILEHFTTHNLFHPNHHGSLANHSTATAITQLHDMWLDAAEKRELSAVCLLDQSAAYDLLCHQTLKEKLEIYNFGKESIEWIMSYLSDRDQQVQVESKTSEPLQGDDHAVPQGSVLGGLLHVLNSNDLPACHEDGEGVVYVDDDSDTVHASDPKELLEKIEKEANNSADWMKDNRLCVSAGKSKLLIIGTKQLKTSKNMGEAKIVVDGKEILESSSEKLLGVTINSEMTWKNQLYGNDEFEGLLSQLGKRIGMIMKLSKFMTKEKLNAFVNGMFYSKLSYCLQVFGNVFELEKYKETSSRYTSYTRRDNHHLQVLQNKMNRFLVNAKKDTPTTELLRRTDTLSVQQLIAYQTAMSVYKILRTGKPSYLAKKLTMTTRSLRGNQGNINQGRKSLSISKEGFLYRGALLFNSLEADVRREPKLERFKELLKKWIKDKIPAKPASKIPYLQTR